MKNIGGYSRGGTIVPGEANAPVIVPYLFAIKPYLAVWPTCACAPPISFVSIFDRRSSPCLTVDRQFTMEFANGLQDSSLQWSLHHHCPTAQVLQTDWWLGWVLQVPVQIKAVPSPCSSGGGWYGQLVVLVGSILSLALKAIAV